jgi:hypothetical protein
MISSDSSVLLDVLEGGWCKIDARTTAAFFGD